MMNYLCIKKNVTIVWDSFSDWNRIFTILQETVLERPTLPTAVLSSRFHAALRFWIVADTLIDVGVTGHVFGRFSVQEKLSSTTLHNSKNLQSSSEALRRDIPETARRKKGTENHWIRRLNLFTSKVDVWNLESKSRKRDGLSWNSFCGVESWKFFRNRWNFKAVKETSELSLKYEQSIFLISMFWVKEV